MRNFRRVAPRQPTDWNARYLLTGGEEVRWRNCRVIDISAAGAGLELFELEPGEVVSGAITITFELRGDPAGVITDHSRRSARVGLRFHTLTEAARRYLETLRESGLHW